MVLCMGDRCLIQSPDIPGSRCTQSGDPRIDGPDPEGDHREAPHDHRTRTPRYQVEACRHEENRPQRGRENPGLVDAPGKNLRSLLVTRVQKDQGMTTILPTLRRSEYVPPAMNLCVRYLHILREDFA